MRPRTVITRPKVERCGNITIITFRPDAIRDVENVIACELLGLTDGLRDRHLLLDFTNVEYLNSMELGTLVTLHKRVRADGGRLTLFNLSTQVFQLFTVTRLDTLLNITRECMMTGPQVLPCEATGAPNPSAS